MTATVAMERHNVLNFEYDHGQSPCMTLCMAVRATCVTLPVARVDHCGKLSDCDQCGSVK